MYLFKKNIPYALAWPRKNDFKSGSTNRKSFVSLSRRIVKNCYLSLVYLDAWCSIFSIVSVNHDKETGAKRNETFSSPMTSGKRDLFVERREYEMRISRGNDTLSTTYAQQRDTRPIRY